MAFHFFFGVLIYFLMTGLFQTSNYKIIHCIPSDLNCHLLNIKKKSHKHCNYFFSHIFYNLLSFSYCMRDHWCLLKHRMEKADLVPFHGFLFHLVIGKHLIFSNSLLDSVSRLQISGRHADGIVPH